jgi:hypothetical protein
MLLGYEDVELLSVGWAAFPRVSEILSCLIVMEDLFIADATPKGAYQHLRPTFTLALESLKKKYPKLGGHIDRMSAMDAKLTIDIDDESGRLIRSRIDTKNRRVSFELFVKDGKLLPVRDGRVRIDRPIDIKTIASQKPWRLVTTTEIEAYPMGLNVIIRNYRTRLVVATNQRSAVVASRTTEIPDIRITGNAFGLIPAAFIDLLIPGSLESFARDFIATACNGNDGQGIVTDIRLDQPTAGARATVDIRAAFEVSDNAWVKLGMSMMSDKATRDQEVAEDLRKIMRDIHSAFLSDLSRFSKIARQ